MYESCDDYLLMLSGIQHIAFCERQWALIHLEQQWIENVLTVEGHHMHDHVDDPFAYESRGNLLVLRSVPLATRRLGLSGRADVVELYRSEKEIPDCTISFDSEKGWWIVVPVEYKRGKPKPDECDEVQLCAQNYALEETYNIHISKGYLYYGETRHRYEVFFSDALRQKTKELALRMHELYDMGMTPAPIPKPRCKSCSLFNLCLPGIKTTYPDVSSYIERNLDIP